MTAERGRDTKREEIGKIKIHERNAREGNTDQGKTQETTETRDSHEGGIKRQREAPTPTRRLSATSLKKYALTPSQLQPHARTCSLLRNGTVR